MSVDLMAGMSVVQSARKMAKWLAEWKGNLLAVSWARMMDIRMVGRKAQKMADYLAEVMARLMVDDLAAQTAALKARRLVLRWVEMRVEMLAST